MASYCTCRHLKEHHRSMAVAGSRTKVEFCDSCDGCAGFMPGPVPLHKRRKGAELVVDEQHGEVVLPTDPAAPSTLILAWDSWWCETCSARTWVEGARCHGQLMTPVRVEMHSREPL